MKRILIEIVPHKDQRYPTVGDWYFEAQPNQDSVLIETLVIRVSDMDNYRTEMCVVVHELVEAILCRWSGVTARMVDRWDMGPGKDLDEPGDDPRAPYYLQHQRATSIERLLCDMLTMRWHRYDAIVQSVGEEEPSAETD